MNNKFKSKIYQKRPFSLIVGGVNKLGFELADLLLQQNGYVIFIDEYTDENLKKLSLFSKDSLISFLDYSAIPTLDEDLKRLDYVFFFNHDCVNPDTHSKYRAKRKNYIDMVLSLSAKYKSKFLLTSELSINSNKVSSDDIEFKKYAKKLTREYIEKVDLNGRIVVLGELLGDGMDFECYSKVNRLILNAARGETLQIPRKAMEKDWFVHILDAAHALFKAQFSRITSGGTYFAAYENPFTYISLAYKVQEIEENAQDIGFYDEESESFLFDIKSLQLLNEVGWLPKVSVEKAIKQSIASAKIYLIEKENPEPDKKGIKKKIRAFFELEHDVVRDQYSDELAGPMARLVMERKRQEESVRRSLMENSKLIENHRMKRPVYLTEKIEDTSLSFVQKLKKYFTNLRNQPRSKLLKHIIIIFFVGFIYAFVIAPAIIIVKDVSVLLISYENLKQELGEMKYPEASQSIKNITYSLDDATYILDRYSFIFELIGEDQSLSTIKENLRAYKLLSDGLANIAYSIEPISRYFSNYQSNLEKKSKGEGYLKVTSSNSDYENIILDAVDRSPYLKLGNDKIEKSFSSLSQIDYNTIPFFLSEKFIAINQEIRTIKGNLTYLESVEYIPELLGVYKEKTYAVTLLDNTSPKPIGGKIAMLMLVTVTNGDIKDIQIKDVLNDEYRFDSFSKTLIQDIDLNLLTSREELNSLDNLSTISNIEQYTHALNLFIQENFKANIDGTILLNFSALEGFIYKFSDIYTFESSGINFSRESFLKYLQTEESTDKKLDIVTDLTAQLFRNILNDFGNNAKFFYEQSYEEIISQNIVIDIPNMEYSSFVERMDLNLSKINSSDIFLKTYFNSNESSKNGHPSASIKTEMTVTRDEILSFRTVISFAGNNNLTDISLCLPLYISEKDIQVAQLPNEKYKIKANKQSQCIVADVNELNDIEIKWNIKNFKFQESGLPLELTFGKIRGLLTSLNFTLVLEPEVKLTNYEGLIQTDAQRYTYSGNLSSDKSIKLTISK